MSSILKALQKLESTSSQQAKGRLLTGKAPPGPSRRRRVLWIFLIFFFVIAPGGFFLLKQSPHNLKSNAHITADKPAIEALVPSAKSGPVGGKSLETAPKNPVRTDLDLKKSRQQYPLKSLQAKTVPPSVALPPPPSDKRPDQTRSADINKPVTQNTEKYKHPPQTVPKPPSGQTDEITTPPDIQMIEPSILRLQAISWSPDEKERMAVINNHVLREKNSIEGYLIILIDQDSVILEKNAEKRRLAF